MNRFIVIDLETTGNRPESDSIIQVGAILVEDNQIKEEFSSFVHTDQEIPPFIQKLTGITPEMLKDAPALEEVLTSLLPLLQDSIFVAHNADFDLSFIQSALVEVGYMPFNGLVVDTLDLARILLPMVQSYKLTEITEELEILHDNPHRADDDARATAELLTKLLTQLAEMPLIYLQRLYELLKTSHRDLAMIVERTISTKYTSYNDDDSDYIVFNQIALQRPIDDEITHDKERVYTNQQLEAMFDEDGLLNDQFPEFELRPAQKEMAKEVWSAFNEQHNLMVEAGTGTGKSLAYLIPSIFYAKENDEKVVIATHTINLQEQLYQRDIPLIKSILPFDFSATILKGRNNYLCLRKYEQLLLQYDSTDTNKEYAVDLAQILSWVTTTKTGDVEEINLSTTGRGVWNQIKSDADSCLNRYCPWFRNCFYHRARNRALESDIIITNHSLLLTNLKADHRILPAYSRLVVDEAHQFEDVALRHLGFELNQYQVNSLLLRFYKDARNGFLIKMVNELVATQDPDHFVIANQIQNNILPLITKIDVNFTLYFNLLGDFINETVKSQDFGRKTLRIIPTVKNSEGWKQLMLASENVYLDLVEWVNEMEDISKKLKGIEIEETLLSDFNGHLKDLKELMFIFSEWNSSNDNNKVYWAETVVKGKRNISYLFGSPIEIGPYLKEYLFDKLDSTVLTSATLSVNDSFDYMSREFGFDIEDDSVKKIQLSSPFDYQKQSILFIPKDAPNIQEVSNNKYIEHLAKNIADVAVSLGGRTLVLFTSHQMLQKTYDLLKDILNPFQIKVLGHGIDSNSRSKLTKQFSSNTNTVLLGTNSFWEGVDIPGEALTALIIVRLPFTPPNNPIHEAKTEKLKERNRNSFMELSVPQAVIRFKQGFGRLIRTKKDRGVVIIFDRRVADTRYGKAFIKSLPKIDISYKPFSDIIEEMENWLYTKK